MNTILVIWIAISFFIRDKFDCFHFIAKNSTFIITLLKDEYSLLMLPPPKYLFKILWLMDFPGSKIPYFTYLGFCGWWTFLGAKYLLSHIWSKNACLYVWLFIEKPYIKSFWREFQILQISKLKANSLQFFKLFWIKSLLSPFHEVSYCYRVENTSAIYLSLCLTPLSTDREWINLCEIFMCCLLYY